MMVTMDRYESDWSIVERGWDAHVLGEAPNKFTDAHTAGGWVGGWVGLGLRRGRGPVGGWVG
jgi:hypothetical protein